MAKNKYISAVKDNFDYWDKWGSSTAWAFSLCDFMADNLPYVPDYWEYTQSMAGSDNDAYEYTFIEELFSFEDKDCTDELLQFSAILYRYIEILRNKGLSY